MLKPVVIGTRGSQLALWQANWVRTALRSVSREAVELLVIKTRAIKSWTCRLPKSAARGCS
jgi:hydroxymethylbilane synthase